MSEKTYMQDCCSSVLATLLFVRPCLVYIVCVCVVARIILPIFAILQSLQLENVFRISLYKNVCERMCFYLAIFQVLLFYVPKG